MNTCRILSIKVSWMDYFLQRVRPVFPCIGLSWGWGGGSRESILRCRYNPLFLLCCFWKPSQGVSKTPKGDRAGSFTDYRWPQPHPTTNSTNLPKPNSCFVKKTLLFFRLVNPTSLNATAHAAGHEAEAKKITAALASVYTRGPASNQFIHHKLGCGRKSHRRFWSFALDALMIFFN